MQWFNDSSFKSFPVVVCHLLLWKHMALLYLIWTLCNGGTANVECMVNLYWVMFLKRMAFLFLKGTDHVNRPPMQKMEEKHVYLLSYISPLPFMERSTFLVPVYVFDGLTVLVFSTMNSQAGVFLEVSVFFIFELMQVCVHEIVEEYCF